MKIKRKSRARKALAFYRAAYGIKPPYHVLIDGTALHMAATLQLSPQVELAKLLGSSARVFVTRAVVAELRALGKEYKAATAAAKRLPKLDGGSSQAGAAADSVVEAVGEGNARRLCVLTEDAALQRRLAQMAGVPLLRFARQQLVLEPAGEQSKQAAVRATHALETVGDAPADAAAPKRSSIAKRKRKQPNPLSCLKKRKRQEPSGAAKRTRRKRARQNSGLPGSAADAGHVNSAS